MCIPIKLFLEFFLADTSHLCNSYDLYSNEDPLAYLLLFSSVRHIYNRSTHCYMGQHFDKGDDGRWSPNVRTTPATSSGGSWSLAGGGTNRPTHAHCKMMDSSMVSDRRYIWAVKYKKRRGRKGRRRRNVSSIVLKRFIY